MAGLIQLNKVFATGKRSLSMHPYIYNKLMSMHLKLHVNASRSEILFLPGHQQDTSVSKNQPSWTLPQLLLTKYWRQLHQSIYIMWDIRRAAFPTACVVHLEGCIDICQCILDSYPLSMPQYDRLTFVGRIKSYHFIFIWENQGFKCQGRTH